MSRKQKGSGLGKALINKLQRKRFVGTGQRAPIFFQQTQQNEADKKKMKMQSVLQQNSLTEYLQIAQMSQQDFHANRNIKFKEIREELVSKKIILNENKNKKHEKNVNLNAVLGGLQVPRRPNWQKAQNKDKLQQLENEAYLNWRRKLAEIQQGPENLEITPYEKNIEVWRQLWRVVQRVDVLTQIIDGRNPLFFYSDDLFSYAREVGKSKFMLIINKSDLVSQKTRLQWNKYFLQLGINHCFFTSKEGAIVEGEQVIEQNSPKILSPHQLVVLFQQFAEPGKTVQIGLTGYPNVGKSSVINAVLGRKKVGVASMPGKTKHFQTLKLTEQVTLCDCPGLVFPKVHESKAQMILNGLYSIDTLKQFEQSLQMVAFRVDKEDIQKLYSIHWKQNQPYDGEAILDKYARLKGFFTGSGLPNRAKAARYILKDYVNGILVYSHPPPSNQKQLTFEERQAELEQEKLNFAKQEQQIQQNLDENFFEKEEIKIKNIEEIVNTLSEQDFLDIVEGRRVEGMKITKEMRKDIKFAMKRGSKIEEIRKYLMGVQSSGHKTLVKN